MYVLSANNPSKQPRLSLTCVSSILRAKTFVLLSLLLGFCITAMRASGQSHEETNKPSTVYGTVINWVTHDPIARALVSSPDNRFAAFTDAEGRFQFTLPAGNAAALSSPTARKPGYLDDPNERRQIEPLADAELTIRLMPEALIKGRVTLSTTDAAAGVTVQIFPQQVRDGITRWVPGTAARANSNGEFRFAELPPGTYKLFTHEFMENDPAVSLPGDQLYGFPPIYYPNANNFVSASTIQLAAGQTFQADLSLVSQPYYPVRIPVTSAEINGGVNVTVSPQSHSGPGFSLGYNPQKQRIEGSLPSGSYLVEGAMYGPHPTFGTRNITVAGAPLEASAMVLSRNGSINVDVKEEFTSTEPSPAVSWSDGHRNFTFHGPRTYLQVWLEDADGFRQKGGGGLRQPTGPNDDSLVIENVPPG